MNSRCSPWHRLILVGGLVCRQEEKGKKEVLGSTHVPHNPCGNFLNSQSPSSQLVYFVVAKLSIKYLAKMDQKIDRLLNGLRKRFYLMKADMDESAPHSDAWAYTTGSKMDYGVYLTQ
jgi:hypothetical protein